MKLLKELDAKKREIYDYFGYVEDWVVIPLDDSTHQYWNLKDGKEDGQVRYADEKHDLINLTGNHYDCEIYTQRFLPKWVYRGKDYTMIVVDTQTDGNKFLAIFSNDKEILTKDMIVNEY